LQIYSVLVFKQKKFPYKNREIPYDCLNHPKIISIKGGVSLLELLTQDEVELASALCSVNLVESVSPVDTHHTNHWQEDAHTYAGRTLHVEWVELVYCCPSVTALGKGKAVDAC
jgi:hypothetical protein